MSALEKLGEAARRARAYISPWNVFSPTDVASNLPGGGLASAAPFYGEGLKKTAEATKAFREGRFGDAARYYGSGVLDTATAGLSAAGDVAPMAKLAMTMVPAAKKAAGIRAFHGSPHDFDRFDMSKIGSGEGAQAYGHGLYFAEAEDVAKGYRDRIAGADWVDKRGVPQQSNNIMEDVVAQLRKDGMGLIDAEEAASFWSMVARDGDKAENLPGYASIKKVLDEKGIRLREKGKMYEVRINADPEQFLDWDKPLSEQSEAVRRFFPKDIWGHKYGSMTGGEVYESLIDEVARERTGKMSVSSLAPSDRTGAVRMLREAGVPGIRYLDQGSRGAGDGTRNYVVFDEKLIEIIRKYGWAPGMAIPAAMALEMQQAQEQSAPQM